MTIGWRVTTMSAETSEADCVCHDEQLQVWAQEMMEALMFGDFLRDGLSYADGVYLEHVVMREIKEIVTRAFSHPGREMPS